MRVDAIVLRVDRDAIRRQTKRSRTAIPMFHSPFGHRRDLRQRLRHHCPRADRRLDELAGTVCEADPRTKAQRRADALTALVAGADRMMCTCGDSSCAESRGRLRNRNVVIHVVAERASVDGTGTTPGYMAGVDELIPPQVVAELAKSATLRPLTFSAAVELRYTPSAALADFVRCRDLTCRAPGCDEPAVHCDIDHTLPYADRG